MGLSKIENINIVETPGLRPSLTYKIDETKKRAIGRIDHIAALEQFVRKILSTQRFGFLIYNQNYGTDLNLLKNPNAPKSFLEKESKRVITAALLSDKRILSVNNFVFDFKDNKMKISFLVKTILEKELTITIGGGF